MAIRRFLAILTSLALIVGSFGCQPAATTAPVSPASLKPNLPKSVSEGVTSLTKLNSDIKNAFESGNPHDCDGALHEAADILSALPGIATDEGALGAEDLEKLTTAAKDLFTHYMGIHEGFHGHSGGGDGEHGEEGDAYSAVSEKIDEALSQLQSLSNG